jgi:hypothetical protein
MDVGRCPPWSARSRWPTPARDPHRPGDDASRRSPTGRLPEQHHLVEARPPGPSSLSVVVGPPARAAAGLAAAGTGACGGWRVALSGMAARGQRRGLTTYTVARAGEVERRSYLRPPQVVGSTRPAWWAPRPRALLELARHGDPPGAGGRPPAAARSRPVGSSRGWPPSPRRCSPRTGGRWPRGSSATWRGCGRGARRRRSTSTGPAGGCPSPRAPSSWCGASPPPTSRCAPPSQVRGWRCWRPPGLRPRPSTTRCAPGSPPAVCWRARGSTSSPPTAPASCAPATTSSSPRPTATAGCLNSQAATVTGIDPAREQVSVRVDDEPRPPPSTPGSARRRQAGQLRAHRAQGARPDLRHLVAGSSTLTAETAYTAMSRGRTTNYLFLAPTRPRRDDAQAATHRHRAADAGRARCAQPAPGAGLELTDAGVGGPSIAVPGRRPSTQFPGPGGASPSVAVARRHRDGAVIRCNAARARGTDHVTAARCRGYHAS